MAALRIVLRQSDAAAGRVAAMATTLGQIALIGLGSHLAADRLDDHLYRYLHQAQASMAELTVPGLISLAESTGLAPGRVVGWADVSLASPSALLALLIELTAVLLLAGCIVLTPRTTRLSLQGWWKARSIHALVMPLTLLGTTLAGAWSLAMAAEDLLPASEYTSGVSLLLALAALARFGLPAVGRAIAALDAGAPWRTGLKRALILTPIGALVWLEALPIWGLPQLVGLTP